MSMLDVLKNMVTQLNSRDPLLQRGIERDWVCVINPSLVTPIKELEKALTLFPTGDLRTITGRETWILNSAPRDRVEYMTREVMYQTYAQEFAAQARLAMMRKEREDENAAPGTGEPFGSEPGNGGAE